MNELGINECALLLCIIGGKIEKANKRRFPTMEEAFDYLSGKTKELASEEISEDFLESEDDMDYIPEIKEEYKQIKLF